MARLRLLVDTSILVDYLRKKNKQKSDFYHLSTSHDLFISAITEFELLVGIRPANRSFVVQLISNLPVLSFDSSCVAIAAALHADLKAKNQLIGLPDLFIAATAVTHDLSLVTLNRRHFERIQGLRLHDPGSP